MTTLSRLRKTLRCLIHGLWIATTTGWTLWAFGRLVLLGGTISPREEAGAVAPDFLPVAGAALAVLCSAWQSARDKNIGPACCRHTAVCLLLTRLV